MQTFIGAIYENENELNGMNKILKQLHEFVAFVGDGEEREYYHQAVVGDQLTVERAVNAHITCNSHLQSNYQDCNLKQLIGMQETKQ